MMRHIKSCGTMTYMVDRQQTYLFLLIKHQKTHHWGFPKGHQEANELDHETALRETQEEVGLDVLLYHHIKDHVIYHPNPSVEKTVTYYLAEAKDHRCHIQKEEVIEARWLAYDAVLRTLTYDTDKHAFISVIHQAQDKHIFRNPHLIAHIENNVLPIYHGLDGAHQIDHARKVIDESLALARHHDVDHQMVYTIAAYHDVGMIHGRSHHHIKGGEMLEADHVLKKWFSHEEIYIMKQAVIDHRASQSDPPHTIYGQIIAQADRDMDLDVIIERIVAYGKDHHPNLSFDQFFEEGYQHLVEKYGKDGYMNVWIKTDETLAKIRKLQDEIMNRNVIFERFHALFHRK